MKKRATFASAVGVLAVFVLAFCLASMPVAAQNPSQVGQFSSVMTWPVESIHMNLLPNGKVMFWGDYNTSLTAYIWDPILNTTTATAKAPYQGFCSAHVLMENGQLMVLGGLSEGAGIAGVPDARVYDYTTDTWTADAIVPDMNDGRYYPTATALANGNILIMSGDATKSVNNLPQIFQANLPACSTSPIPTAPLPASCWINLTGATLSVQLYPKNFVAPNGEVFNAGPIPVSRYLNMTGAGSWVTVGPTFNKIVRDYAPAVMYDSGKVMISGGARPPSATAEIINLNATKPSWTPIASMNFARRQENATILADGTVFVSGGSNGNNIVFDDYTNPVYPTEIWNPATGSWTIQASLTRYRGYHSGALLLPDGRVISAGGDKSCANQTMKPCTIPSAEVFSPAYLFQGARPTITSAPTNVTYNTQYQIETPNASSITNVTFIKLGNVTHTFNMGQRNVFLNFTQSAGGITVTTPLDANLAPPGYYMMFIVENGVPSVAAMMQIQ